MSVLVVTAACSTGSGAATQSPPALTNAASHEETQTMQFSRTPPPRVPAVVHDGVRYEQVMNARTLGYDQVSGYLAAFDAKSGARLWATKVYDVRHDATVEADVQDVYFTRLDVVQGKNQLLIENEAGEKFIFDLKRRSVSRAP
jgi:hypothetical protein